MATEMKADVVVVGLGAMGAAVVNQLAERGVNVIGVDRYVPPHDMGSSHGATRITRQAVGEGAAYVPFVLESQRRWLELQALSGELLFKQCGVTVITNPVGQGTHHGKPDFFKTTVKTAQTFHIDFEILERDEFVVRYPQFGGMQAGQRAYYEPNGGVVIPEKCIDVQLKQAQCHGATLLTQHKVEKIERSLGGAKVITDKAVIRAEKVVVSTGAWTSELLGPYFEKLLTVRRQTLHWFALDPGFHSFENSPAYIWMYGEGDTDYFYGFPQMPGEHSIKVASEQYLVATTADGVERHVSAEESSEIFDRHLKGRLIGITSQAVKSSACVYTVTPDHEFIIDDVPDMPEVLVISACSGHGFKHSAGIGRAVAERLTGASTGFDLTPFGLDRFK